MKEDHYDKTILVYNGNPYFLEPTPEGYSGNVCNYCDLREVCEGTGDEFKLLDLCSPDEGEAPYRFRINWHQIDKTLLTLIEEQQEYVTPPSEARLIQDVEKK